MFSSIFLSVTVEHNPIDVDAIAEADDDNDNNNNNDDASFCLLYHLVMNILFNITDGCTIGRVLRSLDKIFF